MLAGFHAMDEHFRDAPFERNLPVLMGLLAVWYGDFFGAQTVAVLPYDQYLKRFPAYLQQLTMESNGKHVTLDGRRSTTRPAPIYWGEPGTNGQHSFYQLIHQGTQLIPCDFIGFCRAAQPARRPPRPADRERIRAGRGAGVRQDGRRGRAPRASPEWLVPHRVFEGNRPTNTILAERLDPRDARHAGRAVRAQRLHPGHDLGDRLVRPVGGRAGQGAGAADHPGAAGRRRAGAVARQLDQRADPPLPGRPQRWLSRGPCRCPAPGSPRSCSTSTAP